MRILLLLSLIGLAACTPRGEFTFSDAGADLGEVRRIYTATTRGPTQDIQRFGSARSEGLNFARYDVSVPPDRQPGEIAWPRRGDLDPQRHFVTRGEARFAERQAFRNALRADLSRLPRGQRDVGIFVHGFNMTFAEGVYRMAQMTHDFDVPGVAVHFAWPSAATPLGYVFDRDSAMFSRDGLADLLDLVVEAGADRVVILAHSMGGFLTMEALRQVSLAGDARVKRALSGVVLMSPDIDIEVFRAQARSIQPLPQPFFIFVSRRDRALALSARLTGQRERLGNIGTAEQVADLNVTLIDVSDFAEGDGLNHFTTGNSPGLIRILSRLPELDQAFQRGQSVQPGLLPGTVLTVQNATEIILSPLVGVAD